MRQKLHGTIPLERGVLIKCRGELRKEDRDALDSVLLSSAGWRHGSDQKVLSQRIHLHCIPQQHQTRPGLTHGHMEGLEEDIKEVDSLLSVAVRPLVRGRLALLLSDLQQVRFCSHWCWGAVIGLGVVRVFQFFGPLGPSLKPTSEGQARTPSQCAGESV